MNALLQQSNVVGWKSPFVTRQQVDFHCHIDSCRTSAQSNASIIFGNRVIIDSRHSSPTRKVHDEVLCHNPRCPHGTWSNSRTVFLGPAGLEIILGEPTMNCNLLSRDFQCNVMIWTLKVLSTIIQPIPTSSCKTPNQPPLPVTQAPTSSPKKTVPKKSTKNHVTTINLHMKDFSIKGTIGTQYLNLSSVCFWISSSRYESSDRDTNGYHTSPLEGRGFHKWLWGHHDLPPHSPNRHVITKWRATDNFNLDSGFRLWLYFRNISENVQGRQICNFEFKSSKLQKGERPHTWMSLKFSKWLGSVGYNPNEYTTYK